MDNQKRTNSFTINLNDEEAEMLLKLAKLEERKPRELARILLLRQLKKEIENK